ncbi:MAG: hypothetical protein KAI83_15225 [Thiomargarita sp.]|nr:hypothetical protein [Thiomargarita sp.]
MERNINAKVIILTANETVTDCRRAFKQSACWDYISKNMKGNVFEELHDSIKEAIAYFNQFWHNHNDEEWIENNKEQLDMDWRGTKNLQKRLSCLPLPTAPGCNALAALRPLSSFPKERGPATSMALRRLYFSKKVLWLPETTRHRLSAIPGSQRLNIMANTLP